LRKEEMQMRTNMDLDAQDTIDDCICKLEFINHFFQFVPLQEPEIPIPVSEGISSILRGIIDDLEEITRDEGQEEKTPDVGKEV
jgi:hypothetical protein